MISVTCRRQINSAFGSARWAVRQFGLAQGQISWHVKVVVETMASLVTLRINQSPFWLP
jgi:hypothetical protein